MRSRRPSARLALARVPTLLLVGLLGCVAGGPDEALGSTTEAAMVRAQWQAVYQDVRAGNQLLTQTFGSGGTLPEGCAVESHHGDFDLCLEVDHAPDLGDTVCPSDFAAYAWVTPQVRTSVVMNGGSASVMLFYDGTGVVDDVCIQVYSESLARGETCFYQDCLAAGGPPWLDLVLGTFVPLTAPDVEAALDEAGPVRAPDSVRDAIVYLLRQSARGLLAAEL